MRYKHKTDKHMTVKHTAGQALARQTHSRQADNRQAHTRQTSKMLAALPPPEYEPGLAPLNCESRTRSVALGAAWLPANTNALAEYKLNSSLNGSGKCTCPTAEITSFG